MPGLGHLTRNATLQIVAGEPEVFTLCSENDQMFGSMMHQIRLKWSRPEY